MTLRVTPWGKDNFKATSGEAEAKDWAYWQNRMNRASLVMLAEEGIISPDIASRIAAAQKHAEDIQNQPGVPRLTDIMPLEKMLSNPAVRKLRLFTQEEAAKICSRH